jgi:hypothetical protein
VSPSHINRELLGGASIRIMVKPPKIGSSERRARW